MTAQPGAVIEHTPLIESAPIEMVPMEVVPMEVAPIDAVPPEPIESPSDVAPPIEEPAPPADEPAPPAEVGEAPHLDEWAARGW